MQWDEEKTRLLIQMYRDRRELWDPTSRHFHDKQKRSEAWSALATGLDAPRHLLERKMRRLVVMFDLEVDRRKAKSQNVVDQEWCFYRPLLFLRDRNVTIRSSSELAASDENVLEKAKMWDWVLLVATLLTVLYWQLLPRHGYWGLRPEPDLALPPSGQKHNCNIDKSLAEDEAVCPVDPVLQVDQFWATNAENSCLQLKLHVADENVTDLLVQSMKLTTCKLSPHSVRAACVLSSWHLSDSQLLNSTASSTMRALNYNTVCNNATTAYSIPEPVLVEEIMFATIASRRQKRTTNILANITDELKNKIPNGK